MAHLYIQQNIEYPETAQDDESLEDYIEEEEVETMPIMSTVFSNKLIDFGLSAESEAQRKEEELQNRQGSSKDSTESIVKEVRAGLSYLQVLSANRMKAEIEGNSNLYGDRPGSSHMAERRFSTGTSTNKAGSTKTVTVFSQNSHQRRNSQSSSELPSYVKKMMEKDASLRRLLKTGCVTISQINQPARVNRRSISNVTITKSSAGVFSSQLTSNGNGGDQMNFSLKGGTVIRNQMASELDWSDFPAAQKFLELVRLAESESGETFTVPDVGELEPVNPADFVNTVYRNVSIPSARKFMKANNAVTKPSYRSSPSTSKQSIRPMVPPKPLISASISSPARAGNFIAHCVQPKKAQLSRIAPRSVPNVKQMSMDEEIDPTRFLEVSLLEEDHTTLSDEHRRKYKCPHCPKAFCWSTDLKRHILTHTGERPFKCVYCSANFTRKFLMQKHVRKYHPGMDDTAGKSNTATATVSNGKKISASGSTNGFFMVPPLDTKFTTHEVYEDISNQTQPEYKFNHQGIMFKEEIFEDNADDDGDMYVIPEQNPFQDIEDDEEDENEVDDEERGRIICKEEMLDDDDDEYVDFPEPQQFFSEEVDGDNYHEDIEEENPEQHLLQKYSLESKLTNTNISSRSSSPIIINVFSSNTPISERVVDSGDFDSAASASTAPRRLSQSLVSQLARASAKLKGDMAKTTSAREALRLLVRR